MICKTKTERKELIRVAIEAIDNCVKTGMALYMELEKHGQRIFFLDLDDESLTKESIPVLGKYEYEILSGNKVDSCYSLERDRLCSTADEVYGEFS